MFDKLDAYNLVANLVPGMALIYALGLFGVPVPRSDPVVPFLLVSFVAGVAANRLGSLVIDPVLRSDRLKFLHKKNYISFIIAEKDNPKLENLVANSGLYRTFFTVCFILLITIPTRNAISHFEIPREILIWVSIFILLLVFLFALRKEDSYIKARISNPDD